MKIFCEYCGNRIDTEKETKCTNCGASYRKNKEFVDQDTKNREFEERNMEAQEKILKTQAEVTDIVMNNFKRANKFSKIFLVIPIIMFVVIASLIFSQFIKHSSIGMKEVTVNINEFGKEKDYQAKVTSYKKLENAILTPKEGYEYVTFTIQVENLSRERIYTEEVNCIVGGIAQKSEFIKTLPLWIEKGLTIEGEVTFEVPIDATSYNIRYGDYITIHIEK